MRGTGLTLVETLVVLALLTLLASSLLPSFSYVLTRAHERDVEEKLLDSWKAARVLAQARNQPAVWRIRQAKDGVLVSVQPMDRELPSRDYPLGRCSVAMVVGARSAAAEPQCWQVIVPPHGLTDSLELNMTFDGREVRTVLPGVIDEAVDHGAKRDDGA